MGMRPTAIVFFDKDEFGAKVPFQILRFEEDGVIVRDKDKELKLLYADAVEGILIPPTPPTSP